MYSVYADSMSGETVSCRSSETGDVTANKMKASAFTILLTITVVASASVTTPQLQPRFLYKFPIKNPAFIAAIPTLNASNVDLLVTAFGVSIFGPPVDGVYLARDFNLALSAQRDVQMERVGESIVWPNTVSVIDGDLVVPGGFLVS